jgi:hypothetical protein
MDVSFLTSGGCSASLSGRFTSGEGVLGVYWIGGYVGPRAGLDVVEHRKSSDPSVAQPVASLYSDCTIRARFRWRELFSFRVLYELVLIRWTEEMCLRPWRGKKDRASRKWEKLLYKSCSIEQVNAPIVCLTLYWIERRDAVLSRPLASQSLSDNRIKEGI